MKVVPCITSIVFSQGHNLLHLQAKFTKKRMLINSLLPGNLDILFKYPVQGFHNIIISGH